MLGKKKGDEDLKGATSVSGDGSSFDSNHVKLFIEDKQIYYLVWENMK